MFDQKKEVVVVDCRNCKSMCAFSLSPNCLKCIAKKKFDVVRLQSNLITKEYDHKKNLLSIEPFFIDVRFAMPSKKVKLVEEYVIKTGAKIQIYKRLDSIGYIYAVKIPEMKVNFSQLFDLYKISEKFTKTGETNNLIIKRWYQEFGILEHLFMDENVLEMNVNPPAYKTSIRIVHSKYEECTSNIYPSDEFLNYISTRLKIDTGRPLNKAQPQLDGEIFIKNQRARVATVIDPFSVFGTGYSIRKHREHPWTLPLYLDNHTITDWFAGLMSYIVAHGRSFLVAGPRGSGKTALLGSLILEILPKYRIITIEDTEELPVKSYKDLGYDILPLKVRSALLKEGMEMPFDIGLRTSLRLGDSSLIIGEIRSTEAKVLYEAMRVGAMSNVVAGTIHGDSPYGVYDRVVNDLGVPKGSFKVTDLIVILNLVKSPSGISRLRKVMKVTEVLKDWEDKPVFQDLLLFDPESGNLKPTKELLEGKSVVLKMIMDTTVGYKDYNEVLKDIELRGWSKLAIVEIAGSSKEYLEAEYTSVANVIFSKLLEEINPLKNKEKEKEFKERFKVEVSKKFKEIKEAREEDSNRIIYT